jgi:hypothetical protein
MGVGVSEDFDRSPFFDLVGVGGFLFGVAEGTEMGVRLWLGGLAAVLGLVAIVWGHSRPLISITPHSVLGASAPRVPLAASIPAGKAFACHFERPSATFQCGGAPCSDPPSSFSYSSCPHWRPA